MLRLVTLAAVVLAAGPAPAQQGDPGKLPPLDAKEWKTLDSGMKVWDVKEGVGAAAQKADTVTVHYTGWLLDGTVFDSSRTRGETISFPLNGVIRGWSEGVPGMKPLGVRRLFIPAKMAYGARGVPGTIPPNSTLVFEIQLMSVGK